MRTPAPSPTFVPLASKRSIATLADWSAAALDCVFSSDDGLPHATVDAANAPRQLTRTAAPAAPRARFIMSNVDCT